MIIASFLQYFIIAHDGPIHASTPCNRIYLLWFSIKEKETHFLVRSLFLFKQMLSIQFNESRERIDLNYGLFEYDDRAPENSLVALSPLRC